MSQPTVSRHIARLEEQTGLRLMSRTRTGVVLTTDGEALLKQVRKMAESASHLETGVPHEGNVLGGTVRITASRIISAFILPEVLVRLHREEPEISLELVASDETENLHYREADIALRMFRPAQPDVITRKIADLQMGAYASHEYLARKGEPETVEDIFNHDVIGYDKSTLIIDGFARLGHRVSRDFFVFRSDDQVVCWNMVVAGYGIGFNQVAIGDNEPRVQRVGPVADVGTLPLWLTAHAAVRTNPAIRRVYDFFSDALKPKSGSSKHGVQ